MVENERAGAGSPPPSLSCALGEALTHGGEGESARDVLQQAAERGDALEMPMLPADARRLLGATVA